MAKMKTVDQTYSGIDNLEVLACAKNYNGYLINQIQSESKHTDRLIDFGAGTGYFASTLRDNAKTVVCIETDPSLSDRLHSNNFITHTHLSNISDDSSDFIYTLNVLEHIDDDLSAMSNLFSKLRPGGKLFVYVPAFNVLYSSMDRKVGHHRRYTHDELCAKLSVIGFNILRSEYVDSLGFFASLVFKYFGNANGTIDERSVRIYDRFIFPLSRLLDQVTHPLFGKNLLVVATKPGQENH